MSSRRGAIRAFIWSTNLQIRLVLVNTRPRFPRRPGLPGRPDHYPRELVVAGHLKQRVPFRRFFSAGTAPAGPTCPFGSESLLR